jgi:hypothetical protein
VSENKSQFFDNFINSYCFIFPEDEDGKVLSSLPKRPVPKEIFLKLCEERRKFPILYKVEFQVIILSFDPIYFFLFKNLIV